MLAEFTVSPVGKETSLSRYVALMIDEVEKSGLDYRLTAMGTILEGEEDEVFSLIRRCHSIMRKHADRVITTIKIDDRAGVTGALTSKIESIEKRLGHPVKR